MYCGAQSCRPSLLDYSFYSSLSGVYSSNSRRVNYCLSRVNSCYNFRSDAVHSRAIRSVSFAVTTARSKGSCKSYECESEKLLHLRFC